MDTWLKTFPDITFKPANILSKGDILAFEVTLAGTNKGPLQTPHGEVPPTNKRIEFQGVGYWRVNTQGLIAEERRYYDTATIGKQLGQVP